MSSRHGTMTFTCYLVLGQSDQPRTSKALLDWRTALLSRLDGQLHLGTAGVAQAIVTKTGSGKLPYAEQEWAAVSATVEVHHRRSHERSRMRSPRMSVHIYPVPDAWLPGVPAAEQDVTAKEAKALVATGAFSLDPPKEKEPDVPADEEAD